MRSGKRSRLLFWIPSTRVCRRCMAAGGCFPNLVHRFGSPKHLGQHNLASVSGENGDKGWCQARNTLNWCWSWFSVMRLQSYGGFGHSSGISKAGGGIGGCAFIAWFLRVPLTVQCNSLTILRSRYFSSTSSVYLHHWESFMCSCHLTPMQNEDLYF